MIMIHLGQHVDSIGVECKVGAFNDAKSVQLVAEGALAEHELSGIRPVQAINAIRSTDPILQGYFVAPSPVSATSGIVSRLETGNRG